MVAQALAPPIGGNVRLPPQEVSSSSTTILIADTIVGIDTRAKNYDPPKGEATKKDTTLTSGPNGPFTLEKFVFEFPSCPSKGAPFRTMHNLNAQAAEHYNIIEYLA